MDDQQKNLARKDQTRGRLPAHPEVPGQDQVLYRVPRYQHAHTLTFLNDYSPEAESQILWDMKRARGETLPAAVTFTETFHNSVPQPESKHGGWAAYILDLAAMGLGWAAQQLGLPTPDIKSVPVLHQAAGTKRKRDDEINNMIRASNKLELSQTPREDSPGGESSPDALFESASDRGSHSTVIATPPPAKVRKTAVRRDHIRNGGGPTSFFPIEAFDNAGSDTEEDSDDDELIAKYGQQPQKQDTRPIETVFGPGVIVYRSFGGTLRVANPKSSQTTMFSPTLVSSH